MFARTAKNLVMYAAILGGGLAIGHYVPQLTRMLTPKYSEGNFSAYYPDTKTQIVVYGTSTCPYCARTRAYLKGRNIAFGDFDVDKSDKGRHDFAQLGGKAVPVILIGKRRLNGFDKEAIDDALAELKTSSI